ncbi:hypothetical protein [Maribellus mangrovi]|uniref:hypothetical protein n=1 Tax=Maribellus mangrovi TaxID=3133146 RepID=UPI0030EBAB61
MNALLIHNDNLPTKLIDSFEHQFLFNIPLTTMLDPEYSFDNEAHKLLSKALSNKNFNVIFVPYTLSKDNYLEFSGLRVSLHIRLTPELNHSECPIVFIGQETKEQIAKLSDFGNILFTSGIFTTQKLDVETIQKQYSWITDNWKSGLDSNKISPSEYQKFLERIKIEPPANYFSHHSITNEWGILRWAEMANIDANLYDEIIRKIKVKHFLYFKYLEVINGARQRFKKKTKKDLKIENSQTSKIYYIDDEANKGWADIFDKVIFKDYHDSFQFYDEFEKGESQEQLLQKVYREIEKKIQEGFNLFIIDLRLCDDDFEISDNEKFSGIQIIKKIKKQNPGIQILVFTASQRLKNSKLCSDLGVTGYIEKENPLDGLSREGSYLKFAEFERKFKLASSRVFLSSLFDKKEKLKNNNWLISKKNIDTKEQDFRDSVFSDGGLLDEIFDLLFLDYKTLSKTALLLSYQILENYANLFGIFEATWKIYNKQNDNVLNYNHSEPLTKFESRKGRYSEMMAADENDIFVGIDFYESRRARKKSDKTFDYNVKYASQIVRIVLVLYYVDQIDTKILDQICKYRFIRNRKIAHANMVTENIEITKKDIIFFIDDLFSKIFLEHK